jgi:hypothetical protein
VRWTPFLPPAPLSRTWRPNLSNHFWVPLLCSILHPRQLSHASHTLSPPWWDPRARVSKEDGVKSRGEAHLVLEGPVQWEVILLFLHSNPLLLSLVACPSFFLHCKISSTLCVIYCQVIIIRGKTGKDKGETGLIKRAIQSQNSSSWRAETWWFCWFCDSYWTFGPSMENSLYCSAPVG